jgi:hypothetical protein
MAAVAVALLIGEPHAAHAEAQAQAQAQTDCEFLEMSATTGDKPVIDAELKPVEKKLKKPPFATWNQFKLLSRSQRPLTKKKVEAIALKVGSATVTLVEIVDKSRVRLTVTMDDGKGKQVANNTTTVEAGDYMIYVHPLANNDGHLLSLTCK